MIPISFVYRISESVITPSQESLDSPGLPTTGFCVTLQKYPDAVTIERKWIYGEEKILAHYLIVAMRSQPEPTGPDICSL